MAADPAPAAPPQAHPLDRLRLASEARLLRELQADPAVAAASEELFKQGGLESERRRLLASALRVNARIIPSLAEAVEKARRLVLPQDRPVEIYVHESPQQNAACIDFGSGPVFVLFSSRILECMNAPELDFVIGHELGHSRFGHHRIPAAGLLAQPGKLRPETAMKLMSWNRRAEISCDRAGLYCCRDLQSAAVSLIKTSCGLREPLLRFDIDAYLEQMRDIESLSEQSDAADWFSTHPFSPLRVVALRHFWASEPFHEAIGKADHGISAAEVEERIEALLAGMDPEQAEKKNPQAREALLWAACWVAVADGVFQTAEVESIAKLLDPASADAALAELRKDPARAHVLIRERFEKAAAACKTLPAPERHALLQKLIVVARADGKLDPREKDVLAKVCEALGVSPNFVEQILKFTE